MCFKVYFHFKRTLGLLSVREAHCSTTPVSSVWLMRMCYIPVLWEVTYFLFLAFTLLKQPLGLEAVLSKSPPFLKYFQVQCVFSTKSLLYSQSFWQGRKKRKVTSHLKWLFFMFSWKIPHLLMRWVSGKSRDIFWDRSQENLINGPFEVCERPT